MPKSFKQLREDIKPKIKLKSSPSQVSDVHKSTRMGGGKSISPSKGKPTVAGHDIDKLRVPTRLGTGKNIEKSNTPTVKGKTLNKPWVKSSKKPEPEIKKPETKKHTPLKSFNRGMEKAAGVASGAVHAGLEKPKQVASVAKKTLGVTSRVTGKVASGAVSGLSAMNKVAHQSKGEYK